MTTYYLASTYGRRVELAGYADQLRADGHDITARWLAGEHEAIDQTADRNTQALWATEDIEDICAATNFLLFTDGQPGRGGKDVELGIAIATGKRITLIGPFTNVFSFLHSIRQYDTFQDYWDRELSA